MYSNRTDSRLGKFSHKADKDPGGPLMGMVRGELAWGPVERPD